MYKLVKELKSGIFHMFCPTLQLVEIVLGQNCVIGPNVKIGNGVRFKTISLFMMSRIETMF